MGAACCRNALAKVRTSSNASASHGLLDPPDPAAPWPGDTFTRAPAAQAPPSFPDAFPSPSGSRGSLSCSVHSQQCQPVFSLSSRRRRSSHPAETAGSVVFPSEQPGDLEHLQQRHQAPQQQPQSVLFTRGTASTRGDRTHCRAASAGACLLTDEQSPSSQQRQQADTGEGRLPVTMRLRQALRASRNRLTARLGNSGAGVAVGSPRRTGEFFCKEEETDIKQEQRESRSFYEVDETHFVRYPPPSRVNILNAPSPAAASVTPPKKTAAIATQSSNAFASFPFLIGEGRWQSCHSAAVSRRQSKFDAWDKRQTQFSKKRRTSRSSGESQGAGGLKKSRTSKTASSSLRAAVNKALPHRLRPATTPDKSRSSSSNLLNCKKLRVPKNHTSNEEQESTKKRAKERLKQEERNASSNSYGSSASTAVGDDDEFFATAGMERWWISGYTDQPQTEAESPVASCFALQNHASSNINSSSEAVSQTVDFLSDYPLASISGAPPGAVAVTSSSSASRSEGAQQATVGRCASFREHQRQQEGQSTNCNHAGGVEKLGDTALNAAHLNSSTDNRLQEGDESPSTAATSQGNSSTGEEPFRWVETDSSSSSRNSGACERSTNGRNGRSCHICTRSSSMESMPFPE